MRKIYSIILFLTLFINTLSVQAEAVNPADDFLHKTNYSFKKAKLNSITYGSNKFVAVGNGGVIKLSSDATAWEGVNPLEHYNTDLKKVVWNEKIFVAVGTGGIIITSENGYDWTVRDSGCLSGENISDVIWDGKQFVAIGGRHSHRGTAAIEVTDSAFVLKSEDGIKWSRDNISNETLPILDNIVFTGKGYYIDSSLYSEDTVNWNNVENNGVIYDCSGTTRLLLKINQQEISVSTDGTNWVTKGKSTLDYDNYFKKILWTGINFVGLNGSNIPEGISVSGDGVNWDSVDNSILSGIKDIAWNGKLFVALGKDADVFHSTDGIKWVKEFSGIREDLYDIVFNGNRFVAVGGSYGTYGLTLSSTDGLNWIMNKGAIDNCLNSVIWNGKEFVAVGGNSAYFSKDGIKWSSTGKQNFMFNDIVWNGKIYVASVSQEVGNSGTIAYSLDGKKWTIKKIGEYEFFNVIAWNGFKFLVIENNTAWTSADGMEWEKKELNFEYLDTIEGIALDGSDFLINTSWGVYKSKDGFNWEKYTPGEIGKYGYNAFIRTVGKSFVRGYGSLGKNDFISPDGKNWAVYESNEKDMICAIAFNDKNKSFVAVGREGTLTYIKQLSDNMIDSEFNSKIAWSKHENKNMVLTKVADNPDELSDDFDKETDNLNSVAYNGVTYVAVGDNGVIRTSNDAVKWMREQSEVKSNLNHVLWNENKFIAVGDKGTVLESVYHEQSWKGYSLGDNLSFKKTIWDGEKYVIFTGNVKIFLSKEDIYLENDFTSKDMWESKKLDDSFYGDFVDAEYNGSNYVLAFNSSLYVSDDLNKWIQAQIEENNKKYDGMEKYYNISWDGEKYSALRSKYINLGRNGMLEFSPQVTEMLVSYDGLHWKVVEQNISIQDSSYLDHYFELIWENDMVTGVIEEWNIVCMPVDLSWAKREIDKQKQINNLVVWNGDSFVLVSKEGAIYTSVDGTKWVNRTTSNNTDGFRPDCTKKMIWDGNRYVLTAPAGVFTSSDGIEWAGENADKESFEAVGEDGTVLRTGTMEWDKISPLTDGKYSDFYMYKNSGGYIAVGGGYRNPLGYASRKFASIFISSDGIAWESVDPGVEGILRSVVYDKGKYVVVGDNGVIITSEDGETWEKQNSGIESNLLDIASNGSNFIAEGENGILLASQDGINWTRVYEDSNVSFYELIWDGMRFAAAASYRTESYGYISAIVASIDGINWETQFVDILYSNVYGSVFAGNSDTYVIATGEELPLSGNNAFIVGRNLGEKPVKVYLNGKKLNFDSVPVIENGRTLVPMRAIFEALGAEVTWDDRNKSVTCFKEKKSITLTIGNTQAVLNNEKYTLDVPPRIVNGRTLVPLRFISESLGTEVLWDAADRKVSITSK